MKWKFLIVILCFFCLGCEKKKELNAFQKEFLKYNDSHYKLDLDGASYVHYSDVSEVNDVISGGSGVIFLGSSSEDSSRHFMEILLSVLDNTGLRDCYYYSSLDGVMGLDSIQNIDLPLVLFVLDGKIVSYRVGDSSLSFTDDDVLEIYNAYSEGVHLVLQDACDESC